MLQLCPRSNHMTLNIASSEQEPDEFTIRGDGQIGDNYPNAHWTIEIDKRGHLSFRNGNNYLAFDDRIPKILTYFSPETTTTPNHQHTKSKKHNKFIKRHKHKFRLHEILGSSEFFSLESVKYRGRYLACLPNGHISVTRDKVQEISHFYVHIIFVYGMPQNVRPSISLADGINSASNEAATSSRTSTAKSLGPFILPRQRTSSGSSDSSTNSGINQLEKSKTATSPFVLQHTYYQDNSAQSQLQIDDVPPSYSAAIATTSTAISNNNNIEKTESITKSNLVPSSSKPENGGASSSSSPPPPAIPAYPATGLIQARKEEYRVGISIPRPPRSSQLSSIQQDLDNRPDSIRLMSFE